MSDLFLSALKLWEIAVSLIRSYASLQSLNCDCRPSTAPISMRPTCIWISRFRATFGGKARKIGTLDCSKSSLSKCHLRKYNALPRSVGLLWAPAAWTGSQIIQVRKSGFPVKSDSFWPFYPDSLLDMQKAHPVPALSYTHPEAGSKRWEGQKPVVIASTVPIGYTNQPPSSGSRSL